MSCNSTKCDPISFKRNVYSQNGEDGVIEYIFDVLGIRSGICCEFGAWDGIHLSNTRKLISEGWKAVFIEKDNCKFEKLVQNFADNSKVYCLNACVAAGNHSLENLLKRNGEAECDEINRLDFLSIDIDGLDYEVFEELDLQVGLICIEVNAGHNPSDLNRVNRKIAKRNIGQPLAVFSSIGNEKGYRLICYTGNAFYLNKNLGHESELPTVSDEQGYRNFLYHLSQREKEWLAKVNLGLVYPYYRFRNRFLSTEALGLEYLIKVGTIDRAKSCFRHYWHHFMLPWGSDFMKRFGK